MVVYDPYDWEMQEDPYPTYKAMRDHAPVYYNETRDFWALSRYDDVLAGFRDSERFSNTQGVALERDQVRDARTVMSMLAMDPPEQTQVRALVSRGFTPRRIRELEPNIRQLANRYIDSFVERGTCDFIDDLAGRLPMDVISEMVGVPESDRDMLRRWADTVVHREEGNANVPPAGMKAAMDILGYFAAHVTAARKEPGDDITGALTRAELDGKKLSDPDIVAFLFLMIIAGNETTTKLLGNALYHLARNPDTRAAVQSDPALIERWVEETLRYDASSQLIGRTLTADLTLHGRTMPEGARVALLIGAANRDERRFPEPDHFDIHRDNTQSLAFGQGTHFCLGASLARLEGRVTLEEVIRRMPDFSVHEDSIERIHSSNVRGFAKLPISF